jgi:hypothetical protein
VFCVERCCISNIVDGTDCDMLWGGSVREIKVLTVMTETVTQQ